MLEHPHEPIQHTIGFDPTSSTARVMQNLAIYGHTPEYGEPDHRPMPEAQDLQRLAADLFSTLTGSLEETALEADLPDLLFALTDLFNRKGDRIQRQLDENEVRQKASQLEQDGSEVRDVELQRYIENGHFLQDKRAALENLRDYHADEFEKYTGTPWRPRSGSKVNHRALTAAVVDSRHYISAKRKNETEVHLPTGTLIAFTGGMDYTDHTRIWNVLDQVHAKYADMVLIHTGGAKGADRIAACWAASRKVPEIPFKPEWSIHGRSAPFKRNDRMLEELPKGVIVFDGNGINHGLARRARELGLPLMDNRTRAE